jgi:hypothetical protein
MAEHALGITSQNPVNLGRGIPAMGKQKLERVFASWQRFRIDISTPGRSCVESYGFFHGAFLCRRGEKDGPSIEKDKSLSMRPAPWAGWILAHRASEDFDGCLISF